MKCAAGYCRLVEGILVVQGQGGYQKQLVDKGLNLCGCIGPINGQPYCPCKMTRLDKEQIKLVDAIGSETRQINLPILVEQEK